MTDADALHLYATRSDRAAFAHLVAAHADLVYAAARRQVQDPALADDVTQAVFILLSRHAARIRPEHLAGWLVRTAYFASKDALKRQRRRQLHEENAMRLRPELTDLEDVHEWDDLRPHLDAALARLRPADRTAIALRYIENRSVTEVAAAMKIAEPTAAKRIQRALARLRRRLSRDLPALSLLTLATLLTRHAIAAAPSAVVITAPSPLAAAIAKSTARLLKLAKFKAAAFTVAAVAITTASLVFAQAKPITTPITDLTPTTAPALKRGTLVDESGKPVPNAPYTLYANENFFQTPRSIGRTDAAGTFPMPAANDPRLPDGVILFDLPGHALAWAELKGGKATAVWGPQASPQIGLRPATTVAGTVTDPSGKPIPNARVELEVEAPSVGRLFVDSDIGQTILTDANGRFHFDRFPDNARCHLTLFAAGFSTYYSGANYKGNFPPIAPGTTDIDITLAPGATLIAQLVKDGQPLARAGVPVEAWPDKGGMIIQRATTDVSGQATFSVAPGNWIAVASLRFDEPAILPSLRVPLAAGEASHVSLETGATLRTVSGTLTTDGKPRSSTSITALMQGKEHFRVARTLSDSSGHFSFSLPPGKFTLETEGFKAGEKVLISLPVDAAGADVTNVSLAIPMEGVWSGQFIDADGHPLQGTIGRDSITVHTDAAGRFYLLPENSSRETEVDYAISDDGRFAWGDCLRPGAHHPNTIILPRAASIAGKIVTPDGAPAPNIHIQLGINVDDGSMTGAMYPHATTAADGSYTIDNIPVGWDVGLIIQGPADISRGGAAIGVLKPGERRTLGDIHLRPPTAQSFQDHGQIPLLEGHATFTSRVLDTSGKPMTGVSVSYGQRRYAWDQGTSDLKGRFSIANLPEATTIELFGTYGGDFMSWSVATDNTPQDLTWNPAPHRTAE